MSSRLVALGLACLVTVPVSAGQTSGARERVTPQKSPATRTADQRLVPPGRKYWDNPDEPGAWIPWNGKCDSTERRMPGADGRLHDEWETQLKAIGALVRACPVFKDIRGYYPQVSGCVSIPGGIGTGPWGGYVHLIVWPPVAVEHSAAGGLQVRSPWLYNIPDLLTIGVNRIGDLAFSWFHGEDNEGQFFELPETRREMGGFPVIGDFLSISVSREPRFTPVTQERAQRWIIHNLKRQASADSSILASARRQYEEFVSPAGQARRAKAIEEAAASQKKPENQELERRHAQAIDKRREQDLLAAAAPRAGSPEAHTAERITQLEARLAAMSTDQRRQPAWYTRNPDGGRRLDYGDIVADGTPGARPLVVPNPAFFDPALPKTTMRLAVTQPDDYKVGARNANEPQWRVFQAVIDQMDWKAVAAMLK
jgi:hypothetical protein